MKFTLLFAGIAFTATGLLLELESALQEKSVIAEELNTIKANLLIEQKTATVYEVHTLLKVQAESSNPDIAKPAEAAAEFLLESFGGWDADLDNADVALLLRKAFAR